MGIIIFAPPPLRLRVPNKKKGILSPSAPQQGSVVHESDGNTIEYFHHGSTEESPTNILILAGVGRENTAENLRRWPQYIICIPNLRVMGRLLPNLAR
jgi:hypothetical protein